MRNTFFSYLVGGVGGLSLLFMPQSVDAAWITFNVVPNNVPGDGTTVVEARIDPQSKTINVVEGVVSFKGTASEQLSVMVETGGSLLTLWPLSPEYREEEKAFQFTGGVPNGFNSEGLLFRMRIFSALSGNATIVWMGGTAYLHDGNGTAEPLFARSLTIALDAQDPDTIGASSPDSTPPHFESTEIGRDPNVYEGKYFISFHAVDDISGVARYEVKEGKAITIVTDGVYIFRNQNRSTPITITAYDEAGNSVTVQIPSRFNWMKSGIVIPLPAVILFFVLRYGYKKIIKK